MTPEQVLIWREFRKEKQKRMANLNEKFKKILNQLEKNIKNEESLEGLKVELFDLYNAFFEELNKMEELSTIRIAELAETQKNLDEKFKKISHDVKEMQKDIYDENDEFSINCPYCNNELFIDTDNLTDEIRCPECNNLVELEWNCECGCEDDECSHGDCDGSCHSKDSKKDEDDM